jgi:hypothetical protein
LYLTTGQTGPALRQYRVCEELLQRELAVAPMPETQELLVQILAANRGGHSREWSGVSGLDGISSALSEIAREMAASMALVQQAIASFDQAQARLQALATLPHADGPIQPVVPSAGFRAAGLAERRHWATKVRQAV